MKQLVLCLLVFLNVLAQDPAIADNYPSKPITVIVGFPPGGGMDLRARQIADPLAKALGQSVIVENRPGASGAIAASVVAKAPHDGYTLWFASIAELAIYPAAQAKPIFDALHDFAPITHAFNGYLNLNVRPGLGVKSFKGLVELAKARAGQLTCAIPGNATPQHIALELLKRRAKVDIVQVPYKGDGPIFTDLLGGHVDLAFNGSAVGMPYVKAGKLVPLAVTSTKRLATLPDVPTMTELGLPELETTLWGGMLAPAGTPPEIVRRLNTELVKILHSPELRESWGNVSLDTVGSSPDEFAALIRVEQLRWANRIKETGVKME